VLSTNTRKKLNFNFAGQVLICDNVVKVTCAPPSASNGKNHVYVVVRLNFSSLAVIFAP